MSMKGYNHIYTPLGNYDNKLESKRAKKWSENLESDIRVCEKLNQNFV